MFLKKILAYFGLLPKKLPALKILDPVAWPVQIVDCPYKRGVCLCCGD